MAKRTKMKATQAGSGSSLGRVAKIKCKHCDCSWENSEAYLKDDVKCGNKGQCKNLSKAERRKARMEEFSKKPARLVYVDGFGKIPSPMTKKEVEKAGLANTYSLPTPVVLTLEIRKVR